ncbi:MAG: NYN domain-containing protein [Planctomycetes bacterium]|nr:NYN domain-containing protein [Planctomycetota bacterium]
MKAIVEPNKEFFAGHRDESKIALFIDFENIALGVREARYKTFEIRKVLERVVEKGKIVLKKAYADWEVYKSYKRPFHEAGIELIDIPRKAYSGKNSADIRMVVDAMDLSFAKDHIDVFAIASGDSDFSPLVSKLKENAKYVMGIGVKNSSSDLLVDNCDEFVYYEDLVRQTSSPKSPSFGKLPEKQQEAFGRVYNAVMALLRQDREVIWGSMVKQAIKRRHPEFNEEYYGYRSFSRLLEDAQKHKILSLQKDPRSGSYIVTLQE